MAARRHGIADKDMVYEQFANLVTSNIDKPIMHDFRKAIGENDAFPSIQAFVLEVVGNGVPEPGKMSLKRVIKASQQDELKLRLCWRR